MTVGGFFEGDGCGRQRRRLRGGGFAGVRFAGVGDDDCDGSRCRFRGYREDRWLSGRSKVEVVAFNQPLFAESAVQNAVSST